MRLTCETAEACKQLGEAMREFIVLSVEVFAVLLFITIVATLAWHSVKGYGM